MHAFHWREALRGLDSNRGLALTTIASLTAALTLCGLFLLLDYNANQALRAIGDRREMIVYLKDGLGDDEVQALSDKVRDYFGEPTYVSRQQAWDELAEQIGDPELLSGVESNPLPASLRVRLKPALLGYEAMQKAAEQVLAFPEVEDVRYGAEYVRRLDEFSAGLRTGALVTGLIVMLAIALVLYTTLRLHVQTRRTQVEIQLRLGATDRFIAMPFVIESSLQAAAAALLALGLVALVPMVVAPRLTGLRFLPWTWALMFVGTAIAVAWAAAGVALARILRRLGG
jgi:cell division transport system permease protein